MNTAQSSHLQNYEYQADSQVLTVTFLNGASYQYGGVSFDDYNRLLQSGGAGSIFWSVIRNRYPATKIAAGTSMAGKGGRRREPARAGGNAQVRQAPGGDGSAQRDVPNAEIQNR